MTQLLEEADYDPGSVIRITSRDNRIPKQVELAEAIHGYMTEAGMNAEINIVEPSVRQAMRLCGIGASVTKVLEDRGEDPETAEISLEDMQAALDAGPACPTGDLINVGGISSETLDFGRQVVNYMDCTRPVSFYCDPSPVAYRHKSPRRWPRQERSGSG